MPEETLAPWFEGKQAAPRKKRLLALTLVYHPDPARIGSSYTHDATSGELELCRTTPLFSAEGTRPGDIGVAGVSRKPVRIQATRTGWSFTPPDNPSYQFDGAPGPVELSNEVLEHGVLVQLAGWVLLWVRTGAGVRDRGGMGLVGCSRGMDALRNSIREVAGSDAAVLVRGPSGAGKELVARAIHERSRRSRQPYFAINLAAVPASSAVSQLFGHTRGAFTGADRNHKGFFQQSDRGTLLIDEIGEVQDEVQPLLLRALENGEIQPLGGEPTHVDARLIFSTDADLEQAVAGGRFRKALYYRIAQLIVDLPALCDRPEDIAVQAVFFLRDALEKSHATHLLAPDKLWLTPAFMGSLMRYSWPGNSRELRAMMQRVVVRSMRRDQVTLEPGELVEHPSRSSSWPVSASTPPTADIPAGPPVPKPGLPPKDELIEALRANGFQIGRTAKALGVGRSRLYQMMDKFRIPTAKELTEPQITAAVEVAGGHMG